MLSPQSKVLFIGNSHMVCLREALSQDRGAFPADVSWLYAPGNRLASLQVTNGVIAPTNASALSLMQERNAETNARLEDFDAFVVVGLSLSPSISAAQFCEARLYKHAVDHLPIVTEDCWNLGIKKRISRTTAFSVARLLRAHSTKPIMLVPQPAPSAALYTWDPNKTSRRRRVARPPRPKIAARHERYVRTQRIWVPVMQSGMGNEVLQNFSDLVCEMAMDNNVTAIPQSLATCDRGCTDERYLRHHETRPTDFIHTNVEYGKEMAAWVRDSLSRESTTSPAE